MILMLEYMASYYRTWTRTLQKLQAALELATEHLRIDPESPELLHIKHIYGIYYGNT